MPRTSKIKEFGARILLLALGCGVGFLLGEGALRLFLPNYVASAGIERNFFCHFDPQLGWAPLPNVSGLHRRDGFAVHIEQNQFGLRAPRPCERKDSPPNNAP